MAGILRVNDDGSVGEQPPLARLLLFAVLLLWLGLTLPLAVGSRTLLLRDVFTSHLPLKAFGAAQLAAGRIPAIDPIWALGQPFRGDPNVLAFYPDNLLYLLLPFWSAFNLHYALHWLLAFFAARRLAATLGQGPLAALLCGLTWAGGGYGLTALTFYNLVVVAAWLPLAMDGVARGGRRGLAIASLALGMALLGGEPVTLAIGGVPLLLVAAERHGLVRAVKSLLLAVAGALLVAAPQLVATARVIGFTTRGSWGTGPEAAGRYALAAARLLELVLPLPFGWPSRQGPFDYWSRDLLRATPFIYSLYFGVAALAMAMIAAPAFRKWAALALAGLLLAWGGGIAPDLLGRISGGLFRYPEKFLLWVALGGSLLAGWGFERWDAIAVGPRRIFAACASGLVASGALLWATQRAVAEWLAPRMLPSSFPAAPGLQVRLLALSALAAGAMLALALALRTRPIALVGLQLLGLAQLAPLWATDEAAPYREAPVWRALLPAAASIARFEALERLPAGPQAPRTSAERARLDGEDLGPAPGVLHGLSYPLAPDLVGLQSPLSARLELELRRLPWEARANWLRRLGADAMIVRGDARAAVGIPLSRLAERLHGGYSSTLFSLTDGVSHHAGALAWWPRVLDAEAETRAAVARLGTVAVPEELSLAPRHLPHTPGATVEVVSEAPDQMSFRIDGAGGVLVVRRAFLPLYRARLEDGSPLPTLPVDLALLGVAVPPGRHAVSVEVSSGPEIGGGVVSCMTCLGLLVLIFRRAP